MNVNLIIRSIYVQIAWMRETLNVEPNIIILGTQALEEIKTYTENLFLYKLADKGLSMFGLPIITDDENVNRVSVCIAYDVPQIKEV